MAKLPCFQIGKNVYPIHSLLRFNEDILAAKGVMFPATEGPPTIEVYFAGREHPYILAGEEREKFLRFVTDNLEIIPLQPYKPQ